MLKVVRGCSKPVPRKKLRVERGSSRDDRISQLPDGILVEILSLLTLKEARSTSILSHRWRYLWTYTTGCWNFEVCGIVTEFWNETKSRPIERAKFIAGVNQALKLHRGPYLNELRICFDLDVSSSSELDGWVNFAARKKVQRLELDFSGFVTHIGPRRYNFPRMDKFPFLFMSNCQNQFNSSSNIITPSSFERFCYLRSLSLKEINVTEEVLGHFLSKCRLLEHLCVISSSCLVNLEISGPSLKLKSLEISHCYALKNLEISAVNLVSFAYIGNKIRVPFEDVPLLSKLYIGGDYSESFIFETQQHLSYLSQLETLRLVFSPQVIEEFLSFPLQFPQLSNLKHLELRIKSCGTRPLLYYTSLIKASPLLSSLKIELILRGPFDSKSQLNGWYSNKRARKATKHPHQCLKVVELVGFVGRAVDIMLALHLIKIAVSLEKMIVNSSQFCMVGIAWDDKYEEERGASRKRAEKLRKKVPPGVKLVIL